MLKQEFLDELEGQLCHLSPSRIEKAMLYHSGIIDGRMENGMSEEEAVAAFGGSEHAALQFIRLGYCEQKHRISNKIKSMPTVSRLFFSTMLTIICFLIVAATWIVIASVYVVAAAILFGGLGLVIGGIVTCFINTVPVGLCVTGGGMVLTAVALLLFSPVRALTKVATAFSTFINNKVRGLLAREALAV